MSSSDVGGHFPSEQAATKALYYLVLSQARCVIG
jgi:hypothetical protein